MARLRNRLTVALLALALVAWAAAAHATLGIDLTPSAPYENGGPTTFGVSTGYTVVGWSFTPKTDLYLTRLGVWDADKDKIHSELHYVGIWAAGNPSSPLASVSINEQTRNVPETSPNGAYFHFGNLTAPLRLSAGATYAVGATLYAGLANSTPDFDAFASIKGDSPVFLNPNITYLGNAYAINGTNGLVFPGSTYTESEYTIGSNIDVTPVPIPGAVLLLGSGLAGIVGMRNLAGRKF